MKIYIASKWSDDGIKQAREAMAALEIDGHSITHNWCDEDPGDRQGDELALYLWQCAVADLRGVEAADAVVAFPHDYGKGLYSEIGVALTRGIPVILVSPKAERMRCIFEVLCTRVETFEHARTLLKEWSIKRRAVDA